MGKKFVLSALIAITLCSLTACIKDPVKPSTPLSNGRVVEFGSNEPLPGVLFSHSTCKKPGDLGCLEWANSAPVLSDANGYLTVPSANLGSPMSFSLLGYWSFIEADLQFGPNPSEDLPSITYQSIGGGSLEFEVQLFPQVPISIHLVNTKTDVDSAGVAIGVSAMLPGNLERSTAYPFYIHRVSDTTVHLLGYGNIVNQIKAININDGNFILNESHMISKVDSLHLEIIY